MVETMIDKHHKNVIKFFQDEMEKFKVNGNIETEIVWVWSWNKNIQVQFIECGLVIAWGIFGLIGSMASTHVVPAYCYQGVF